MAEILASSNLALANGGDALKLASDKPDHVIRFLRTGPVVCINFIVPKQR